MLGMGCDRGTSLETLESAVNTALSSISIERRHIVGLATIDKKNDEVGLVKFAEKHHWLMYFFSAEQLVKVEVPSPSEVVKKYMGTPSVSEAAAILAAAIFDAETDMRDLILEKYKFRGADNKNVTVSIVNMGCEDS